MKKLIFLLVVAINLISCSSDDNAQNENSYLIGNWNWINTSGGINGQVNENYY